MTTTQYETHTAVAVLCSELAHEIAPTLAFLRDVVRSRALAEIDASIAEEEVARLETVIASLRRTKRDEESFATTSLVSIAERAAERAREETPSVRVVIDVPPELRVTASPRGLELLLVSLLRNALRAARHAPVVLRARTEGDAWCIEVEDDGDGLSGDLEARLFMPLATLGADGRGTGVPTVLRITRDHGWENAHARRDDKTVFTVNFNRGDASLASQSPGQS